MPQTGTTTTLAQEEPDVDLDLEFELPDEYESPAVHIRAAVCPENCY